MGAMNNENSPQVSVISLGAISADGEVFGLLLPKKSVIKSAYVKDGAGIVASDTNYIQVSLQNGATVIAELDSRAAHENGLVANVPKAMNVVAADKIVPAGSYLKAVYNEEGTVAMTAGELIVEWFPL